MALSVPSKSSFKLRFYLNFQICCDKFGTVFVFFNKYI